MRLILWFVGLCLWCACTVSAQEWILGDEQLYGGRISPDGKHLAAYSESTLYLFETEHLRLLWIFPAAPNRVDHVAFSPDGRYLAWNLYRPGYLYVWDLTTLTEAFSTPFNVLGIDKVLFTSDGKFLVVQWRDYISVGSPMPGSVDFWHVGSWQRHGSWQPGVVEINSLAFTPDATQFVVQTRRGRLLEEQIHEQSTIDVETLRTLETHLSRERILLYSPHGRWRVYETSGNGAEIYETVTDRLAATLPFGTTSGVILFSSDGMLFSSFFDHRFLTNTLTLWETETWQPVPLIGPPNGRILAQGFVGNACWVAYITPDGLELWDAARGELLAHSTEPYGYSAILPPSYPNPFRTETHLPFVLPQASQVQIRVYDMGGHPVRRIDLGQCKAGDYTAPGHAPRWDGCDDQGESVANGLYLYEVQMDGTKQVGRCVMHR